MTSQNTPLGYAEFITTSLGKLDLATISEHTSRCHICLQEFADQILSSNQEAFQALPFNELLRDDPVILPCGHIFGEVCFTLWSSSGNTTCPMCRAVLFQDETGDGSQDLIRQFRLLPSIPFRTLLKPEWDEKSTVFLKDSANSTGKLVARFAKFIFIVAIRVTLGSGPAKMGLPSSTPTQEFRYPRTTFPLDSDDASNFRNWYRDYLEAFLRANHIDKRCLKGLDLSILDLLSDSRISRYYAFQCAIFKFRADCPCQRIYGCGHAFKLQELYDKMKSAMAREFFINVNDGDPWEPWKVVGSAVKATLEYERRLSELTRQRMEMTRGQGFQVQGLRDLEEDNEVCYEEGRFAYPIGTAAYWYPFSRVAVELE